MKREDLTILVACATNDKKHLVDDHFGEAAFFMIFQLNDEVATEIATIENTAASDQEEDHSHGGGAKAKAIIEHFKTYNVDVFISRQFGPNIKKIRKHVLPVIMKTKLTIQDDLDLCRARLSDIKELLAKPPQERKHLTLNKG